MFTPKYTIEEKRVIVEEWMSSGITMKEFCRRKEINPSTFDGWLNRFYPDREKKIKKRQMQQKLHGKTTVLKQRILKSCF